MSAKWLSFAVAALVACLVIAPAAASAGNGDGPSAAIAKKKKCKKGKKKALLAKKKKCKKPTPKPTPQPGPVVRASVTWSNDVNVDLHAYDDAGLHAGWQLPEDAVVQGIPNAVHSGDLLHGGTESITDNVFVQGGVNRNFHFLICLFGSTTITVTNVTPQGVPNTQTLSGDFGDAFTSDSGNYTPPGDNPCGFA